MGKITVTKNGNQIILKPSGLPVSHNPNGETLQWIPVGGVTITNIEFENPEAPITDPQKEADGSWTAIDTNNNTGPVSESWHYSITIDPEIINEPQGGTPGGEG